MNRRFILLAAVLALAPRLGAAPERRPVEVAGTGWVRLTLDETAQAAADTAWLGDAAGRPLPFVRESTRAPETRPVRVDAIVSGRDAANQSTVEFTLAAEPGAASAAWQVDLATAGETGWAARVEVDRRQGDGSWLRLDDGIDRHVYDFGGDGRRLRVSLPRDADRYRLTLVPAAGMPPTLTGVSARRILAARETLRPVAVDVRPVDGRPGEWLLPVSRRLRVRAIEIDVTDRFAPVSVQVSTNVPPRDGGPPYPRPIALRDGVIWNLPALATTQTRVAFVDGELVDHLVLHLPTGLHVDRVRWHVAEETWLFPAETGQRVYLHTGGVRRTAPGDLARLELPAIDASLPVATLGPAEPDPHADAESRWAFLEKALPWLIAATVALVAWIALRLLRKPESETSR